GKLLLQPVRRVAVTLDADVAPTVSDPINPVDAVDALTRGGITVSGRMVSVFWLGQRSVNAYAAVDRPLTGPLTGDRDRNIRVVNLLTIEAPLRSGPVNAINATKRVLVRQGMVPGAGADHLAGLSHLVQQGLERAAIGALGRRQDVAEGYRRRVAVL